VGGWKKFRNKTYARILGGGISVEEARARYNLEAARRGKPPLRPAASGVVKSAGPGAGREWEHFSDPGIRERAREAAQQALVNKGMLPGAESRPEPGEVRVIVWAPGPDGRLGWRPLEGRAAAGPPVVPPGIAGR
jgi:hypothetical protein